MAKLPIYPFTIQRSEDVKESEQNRQFSIQAPVGDLDDYYELFDEYGFGGNGPSWVEHIRFILAEVDEQLAEHLEYDEEGDTFLVYADSQDAVDRFMKHILPVFVTKKSLKKYLSQANPDNFEE